ncbi:MAG TPA: DinB family protein [Terriglobales bacterium]|nr:DinB family protein [Terriglobales bacterium]
MTTAAITAKPVMDPMLSEFRAEVMITRRVLDRVPAGKLSWKPHPKSMTLGQLAIHIATVPGSISRISQQDSFDVSKGSFVPPQPKNMDEVQAAFEESVREAEKWLTDMTEQQAQAPWRLMFGNKEIFTQPRRSVLRSIMLNHWYHHRGQMSVYLRLLDVSVPVIYGRSADEGPFG